MGVWSSGASYDIYVGRWSRLVAADFVRWLDRPPGARWLDVGSGTGALTEAVLSAAAPTDVVGVDPSADFVAHAAGVIPDPRARFGVGDARALPVVDGSFDVAVSGLTLNFVAERTAVLGELRRAVGPGGTVAAYVWDYPDGMQLMAAYWDAALDLGLAEPTMHEAVRFGFCRRAALQAVFVTAGLTGVDTTPIVVPTAFRDFDDFWSPFLGGTGPAPAHLAALPADQQETLRDAVRDRLPVADDGSVALTARAWAVRGTAP
ncbi:class I SAM-dependent methyltransferase [Blastococcus haudaquaticus]|uniref:Methyltransferase domain-containing protein n=1 Tax=Blastococcus haudaquaticus TaxID=1938745 RepID=A0A286GTD3_9ACTN|nr:class I SAM-dependent methyltransferase [Blastococcus haudaquaticus]SOD98234.1 Methyltransferase domain-containing protein [Blastococcus haudaquaticus]